MSMITIRHLVCVFVLIVLSWDLANAQLHETEYVKTWVRQCPPGQAFSFIQSTYKWFPGGTSDRKWLFRCKTTSLKPYACVWTEYVNGWDADVNYKCDRGVISGMEASGYGKTSSDRMFKFKCCLTEKKPSNEYKTGLVNAIRENFTYNVKNGEYIVGVYSHHENGAGKEDRRWEFTIGKQ